VYQEQVVRFGSNDENIGIICRPKFSAVSNLKHKIGCVLSNTGVGHRVGPFRFHVDLARRLTHYGVTTLRFDLTGMGDSETSNSDENLNKRGVLESLQAMDILKNDHEIEQFILFGNCSAADRIQRLCDYIIKQNIFKNYSILGTIFIDNHAYPTNEFYSRRFFQRIFQTKRWLFAWRRIKKKMLAGSNNDTNVSLEIKKDLPSREQTEEVYHLLCQEKVRQLHIFTESVDIIFNHEKQFFEMFPKLKEFETDLLEIVYLRGVDHTLSYYAPRVKVLTLCEDWVRRIL
jgi:hypothetical protein